MATAGQERDGWGGPGVLGTVFQGNASGRWCSSYSGFLVASSSFPMPKPSRMISVQFLFTPHSYHPDLHLEQFQMQIPDSS